MFRVADDLIQFQQHLPSLHNLAKHTVLAVKGLQLAAECNEEL
jgi:hypothetical protein